MEVESKSENLPFEVLYPGQHPPPTLLPFTKLCSEDFRLGQPQKLIDQGFLPDVYNWDEVPDTITVFAPPKKKRELKDVAGDSKKGTKRSTGLPPVEISPVMPKEERDKLFSMIEKSRSKTRRTNLKERLTKEIIHWAENEKQSYRDQDIACAKAALKFYNQKHGTDYELIATHGSFSGVYNGEMYHCNFVAQSKSVDSSGIRPSPKLFFAELLNDLTAEAVTLCVILSFDNCCAPIRWGCKICPDLLYHPADYKI